MQLHNDNQIFEQLQRATSEFIGVPAEAIMRDYYIVLLLQRLEQSIYAENCVFKGGTSLSKCYPGSINRFSEDIDLTYLPPKTEQLSDKQYGRRIKQIEKMMAEGFASQKDSESNNRSKALYILLNEESKIKLEIGSSVVPQPYAKKCIKSYIHEYLEHIQAMDVIEDYGLQEVHINALSITRTFLDKIMAVKRHSICGKIENKARHIYDVVSLFPRKDIQEFLKNTQELQPLLRLTKDADTYYTEKRNIDTDYDPSGPYAFPIWESDFLKAKDSYEKLHKNLLYTNQKQDFKQAVKVFRKINDIFASMRE